MIQQFIDRHPYLGMEEQGVGIWKSPEYQIIAYDGYLRVSKRDRPWVHVLVLPLTFSYQLMESCLEALFIN